MSGLPLKSVEMGGPEDPGEREELKKKMAFRAPVGVLLSVLHGTPTNELFSGMEMTCSLSSCQRVSMGE